MKSASKNTARGGRPSKAAAGEIGEKILDAATQLFFAEGYGATSIEAIAARARISKRTFYHRFSDKADIFRAVVHRVVERLRPPDTKALFEGKSGEEILRRLAPVVLRASLAPEALALHRLILAEAARFPELALMTNAEGSREEAVRRIAAILQAESRAGRLAVSNPAFAAAQFLQMVVSIPQRRALGLGKPMSANELDAWARDTVNLFLQGCRAA